MINIRYTETVIFQGGVRKLFYISEVKTDAPEVFRNPLQERVYQVLKELKIPYERVDTDEAIGMSDCVLIEKVLQMKMVKTLFLTDRKQTVFYLFVTTGEKKFSSRDFSTAMGISRVSFAPAERMEEILGTAVGAATVFGVLMDEKMQVQVVIDRDVLREDDYGCSDGTTTGYLKIRMQRIIDDFLPWTGHVPTVIEV